MNNEETWVSLDEICKHIHMSRDTVKRLVREEGLPGYKPNGTSWRFKKSQVDEWMQTKKIKAETTTGVKRNVKND